MEPKNHKPASRYLYDYRLNESDFEEDKSQPEEQESSPSSESDSEDNNFESHPLSFKLKPPQSTKVRKKLKFVDSEAEEHHEVQHEDLFERMQDCDICT